MNTQFHTPSFGDEIFDLGDVGGTGTSTPNSSMLSNNNNSYMYQQHSAQTANQTKRMISLHNTSDEYHTANEESFTTNANSMNTTTNNGQQQQQQGGVVTTPTTTMAARKQMIPIMESEPSKPLSAYALFFRDTVSAIKQQNPTCSFQELSKIVASMWDALDPVHKGVYNQKNELAKIEYLKQMKIYRQQLEQQQQQLQQQQQQQEHIQNSNIIMTNTDTINSTPQQSQQNSPQVVTTNNQQQQQFQQSPAPVSNITTNASAPSAEQTQSLTEGEAVQKCTRENCTKRAIINPDWEDEYCSNECVIIHCRNVFNAWVQSNLEAKQQPQQQQQQQQQQSTTT